jgi:isocitrate/isopropylmalate dehydrogenase
MLDHLSHPRGAERIRAAVRAVLLDPEPRTPDLGGDSTTAQVGRAVRDAMLAS